MRVCFLAQQSVSIVSGGPLIQLRETARYLPEFGVEVEYFDQWSPFPRDRYDLVHIFGANFMSYDIALRFRQFGVPYIVSPIFFTAHSSAFVRRTRHLADLGKGFFKGIWTDYGFSAEVCRGAHGVLPNTTDEAELIENGFEIDSAKIAVVPNGVDPRFRDADPSLFESTYGVRDFVLNVGHVGSTRKNVLGLIKAMAGVERPLVIIGKIQHGTYADECLKEAKQNPRVTIIDGLPNDSPLLASAYAACDVFALPSLFETPGIAALEAAMAGAKIVITPHGGTRDYFGSDATYVEPGSVSDIARGITQALSASRPDGLAERIEQQFSWRSVAERTAEAYRRFLD